MREVVIIGAAFFLILIMAVINWQQLGLTLAEALDLLWWFDGL